MEEREMEFQRLLDKLSAFTPRTLDAFNEGASRFAAGAAALYGLTKVTYTGPRHMLRPYKKILRGETVVLVDGAEAGKPLRFAWSFESYTKIVFQAWAANTPDAGARQALERFFHQLYYILTVLLLEQCCKKLSLIDYSTGMENHEAFLRFADDIIAEGRSGEYTALYFNIHNFRSVHQVLTYTEANILMERYCLLVGNAVTRRELVARIGSDNFGALILEENRDYFLDLIQNMVVKYYKDNREHVFCFGATIGAASLDGALDGGEVMMRTTTAYQAARDKRSGIHFYNEDISAELLEQKIILSRFMRAIKNENFFLMYQPKVGTCGREIAGAEALVRWRHGESYVMPGSFIPVLEKDGCITQLDFYVLEKVCAFLRRLREEDIEPVKISVNFSKRHLSNNKLVEEITEVIDRYQVPHEYIEVELTEGEDYHNHSAMRSVVDELDRQGIKTSIDDFGTGYSSLALLKTVQIDTVKIDRSFIPTEPGGPDDKNLLMLKGVVSLAKSMGLTVVAEGVETSTQLGIIEHMGCDVVQGYIFDKPLTEEDFIERLRRRVYTLPEERGALG